MNKEQATQLPEKFKAKHVVSANELSRQLALANTGEEIRSIEYDAVRLRDMLTLASVSIEEANKYGAVVLDAAAKIGELLDPNVLKGQRTDTSHSYGTLPELPSQTKSAYRAQARITAEKREEYKRAMDEAQEVYSKAGLVRFSKGVAANYSSQTNEWYTPEIYVRAVRDVLGEIDLDPASCELANKIVKAKTFFTDKDDGLKKAWHGRVFMNPPYGVEHGKSVAGLFCNKAIGEYEQGRAEEIIILVNSSHSQSWQAPLYQFPVCFVDHRIQFVAGDGSKNENPTFQNIVIYIGPDKQKFADVFRVFGYVMEPIK